MNNNISALFGERVKDLRSQKGWSQEELGNRSGLKETYIGQIERAEKDVTLLCIGKLANAFEMDVYDFMSLIK